MENTPNTMGQDMPSVQAPSGNMAGPSLAGIGKRFVAIVIDCIIIGVVSGALSFGLKGSALGGLLSAVIGFGYFIYFEGSERQATLGKQVMGIKVVTASGGKIDYAKAAVRNLSRILSGILLIGYIMALFTEKEQALHDLIAGTIVVRK